MFSKDAPSSFQKSFATKKESPYSYPEATHFNSKNLCICSSIQGNENYVTPSQLPQEEDRRAFVRKLLQDINARWQKTPYRVIIGKKLIMIKADGKDFVCNPILLQFESEIKKHKAQKFPFQIQNLTCASHFINYGAKCGPFVSALFAAEFTALETYSYANNILQREVPEPAPEVPLKNNSKKIPVRVPLKKKKDTRIPTVSSQEEIRQLLEEINTIEEEISQLEDQRAEIDEACKHLEAIQKKSKGKN